LEGLIDILWLDSCECDNNYSQEQYKGPRGVKVSGRYSFVKNDIAQEYFFTWGEFL